MPFDFSTQAEVILLNMDRIEAGSDGPFSMSYAFDLRPLSLSIKKVGLINPPIVREDEQGKVDIVAGFRRIEVLKSLGRQDVPCKVLPASVSPLECLLLNLYDNLTARTLNDVEKGMVLNRLKRFVSQDSLVGYYMPLLDLPPRISILTYYTALEELEPPLKRGVAERRFSPQTVRALHDRDHRDKIALAEWITEFNLNFNQQKQFIELIDDLSTINEVGISDLMVQDVQLEMFRDEKNNPPQRAKMILDYLRRRRFPRLSQTEKNFQERVSRLRLPKGVGIHHPPYFEGSDYHLDIAFKEGRTLMQKIKQLSLAGELRNICEPD